jgi:hypothetical protein
MFQNILSVVFLQYAKVVQISRLHLVQPMLTVFNKQLHQAETYIVTALHNIAKFSTKISPLSLFDDP